MKKILTFCLIATFTILGCNQANQNEKKKNEQMNLVKNAREAKKLSYESFESCREANPDALEACATFAALASAVDSSIEQLCIFNVVYVQDNDKLKKNIKELDSLIEIYLQMSKNMREMMDSKDKTAKEGILKRLDELGEREKQIKAEMLTNFKEDASLYFNLSTDIEANTKINNCKTMYDDLTNPYNKNADIFFN